MGNRESTEAFESIANRAPRVERRKLRIRSPRPSRPLPAILSRFRPSPSLLPSATYPNVANHPNNLAAALLPAIERGLNDISQLECVSLSLLLVFVARVLLAAVSSICNFNYAYRAHRRVENSPRRGCSGHPDGSIWYRRTDASSTSGDEVGHLRRLDSAVRKIRVPRRRTPPTRIRNARRNGRGHRFAR
jgi:hypothetical protein